jgi:tryptophan 2,3-dioxygenase
VSELIMSDQESINILNSLVCPVNKMSLDQAGKSQNGQSKVPVIQTNGVEVAQANNNNQDDAAPRGCPFFMGQNKPNKINSHSKKFPDLSFQTSISIASEPILYHDYLQLDKILDAQFPVSKKYGNMAHDEHLFIVIHQAYELWFKQLIFELDSIITLLAKPIVDERCLLVVVQRVQRINMIWKLLNDQIAILETMAPTDFIDFRGYLSTASGFQSLQFRIMENKLGLAENMRIKFNQQRYDYLFTDVETKDRLKSSIEEPTLLRLIEAWLERTPGLVTFENAENGNKVEDNFFCKEYEKSVNKYLTDTYLTPADEETDENDRKSLLDEYKKTLDAFCTIFDKEKHDKLVERGERKLSHKALWGALMIWLNRDEPRFHLPYQLLILLTDLDALINRWRYNHALLAQRQVGNKSGTGGSSGYSYLRSTASDRYKIFNDIVNLSTWLIPREYTPKLTEDLKKRLNTFEHA